jgi:hypothetical protein
MEELPTPAPDEIAELAQGCVASVERVLGVELDYSQETLPLLDHYLRAVPEDASDEVLGLVGPMAGAYFGEVIRRHLPAAEWHAPPGEHQQWRLHFAGCSLHLNPVGMAFEAIFGEELVEWAGHLSMADADKRAVRDALERLGEVEAEDYYRLAIRFEAIEVAYHTLMPRRSS